MMVEDLGGYVDAAFDWLILPENAGVAVPNLFLLSMPDGPDQAVALYQYPGDPSIETMGDSSAIERPRLQVMVRDPDQDLALRRCYKIWNLLRRIKEVDINDVHYHKVTSVSSPGPIGRPDSADRFRVTCNLSVWKETDSGD